MAALTADASATVLTVLCAAGAGWGALFVLRMWRAVKRGQSARP